MAASSRTDPALWRRQAWLCSDKDMLNSASHYLHFFSPSRKLKGMQINAGLMRGDRNELKQWSPMRSLQPWRLIGLSRLHRKGGKKAWIRREKLIATESGHHLLKICSAFMSCSVVWGLALVQTIREARRVCPSALCGSASPCSLEENDEQAPARWKGHAS